MKSCLRCGKSLIGRQNKFCSNNCAQNFYYNNLPKERERVKRNSKKSYENNKNKPEFKERRKIYYKKWLEENREKFNKLMRDYYRKKKSKDI